MKQKLLPLVHIIIYIFFCFFCFCKSLLLFCTINLLKRFITSTMVELKGVFTALVTPFTQDGNRVDYTALEALVESQIAAGVDGLVPMGTTGECPTVSHEEHERGH